MAKDTLAFARYLRQTMSLPEMIVWSRIKRRTPGSPIFRRQYPIGPYVLDFYCAKARLVIEIDGIAHGLGDQPERDARRDEWLMAKGLEVVRIAAGDLLHDPDDIIEGVLNLARDRVRKAGR